MKQLDGLILIDNAIVDLSKACGYRIESTDEFQARLDRDKGPNCPKARVPNGATHVVTILWTSGQSSKFAVRESEAQALRDTLPHP